MQAECDGYNKCHQAHLHPCKMVRYVSSGAYLAAVAPVATRMDVSYTCPARVWQQPELRRGRVQASPVIAAEHCQPGLAPASDVSGSFPTLNLHSNSEAFFSYFPFLYAIVLAGCSERNN